MPASTFAARFKLARKALDLTLDQVAEKAGCSKQTLSHIETGTKQEVKMQLLYALADSLKVSPRWLATGKGTQRNTGPMSDEERDVIYLLRELPPGARQFILERIEALAVEVAKKPSATAPFGANTPAKHK